MRLFSWCDEINDVPDLGDNEVGVTEVLVVPDPGEDADREAEVGCLTHDGVRRGVPDLEIILG